MKNTVLKQKVFDAIESKRLIKDTGSRDDADYEDALDDVLHAIKTIPAMTITDNMVKQAAVAMWREEAIRAAPNIASRRTATAFNEESASTKTRWTELARAALVASF